MVANASLRYEYISRVAAQFGRDGDGYLCLLGSAPAVIGAGNRERNHRYRDETEPALAALPAFCFHKRASMQVLQSRHDPLPHVFLPIRLVDGHD
jgi:hypothetical protein